jgi:hypothetical protein
MRLAPNRAVELDAQQEQLRASHRGRYTSQETNP